MSTSPLQHIGGRLIEPSRPSRIHVEHLVISRWDLELEAIKKWKAPAPAAPEKAQPESNGSHD